MAVRGGEGWWCSGREVVELEWPKRSRTLPVPNGHEDPDRLVRLTIFRTQVQLFKVLGQDLGCPKRCWPG